MPQIALSPLIKIGDDKDLCEAYSPSPGILKAKKLLQKIKSEAGGATYSDWSFFIF